MNEIALLKDLVVILGAAALVVAVLRKVGVPAIAGYILTGVAAGPTALALVEDTHEVELLAEVGVVLLLFGVGLELSLSRLSRLWRAVLIGGGVQVGLSIGVAIVAARAWGYGWGTAGFVGCVVAVSSTAIVLRGLSARGELETPHGSIAVGVLVFQDLCVVPMILAIPLLASSAQGSGAPVSGALLALLRTGIILAGVLLAARFFVPRVLAVAARTRERDVFILSVLVVCFGTAWAVSTAGLSLALGAFLAGLVVSGSEFRHQALTDVIPTREVLASVFFVSIGMLLDVGEVARHLGPTLGLLAVILIGKFVVLMIMGAVLRLPIRVAVLTAAALCQVGEFSFVLLKTASGTGLLTSELEHNLLVAVILSMLVTPMAIALGPRLAGGAARVPWLNRRLGVQTPGPDDGAAHRDHVLVAGYGMAGEAVCDALRVLGVPFVAVDLNLENVRRARDAGSPVVLADVTRTEVLDELGAAKAKLAVVAINDPRATERVTTALRAMAPSLPIIVRVAFAIDEPCVRAAGATQVVTAERTAGQALAEAVRDCVASA